MSSFNQENHSRFYIYRKIGAGNIQYREQTGNWVNEFERANLWSDWDFVVKKQKELQLQHKGFTSMSRYELSIGEVLVQVIS